MCGRISNGRTSQLGKISSASLKIDWYFKVEDVDQD